MIDDSLQLLVVMSPSSVRRRVAPDSELQLVAYLFFGVLDGRFNSSRG